MQLSASRVQSIRMQRGVAARPPSVLARLPPMPVVRVHSAAKHAKRTPASSASSRVAAAAMRDPWGPAPSSRARATADVVQDFDGKFGAAAKQAVPESVLEELAPAERMTVGLFQSAGPSVVNISTTVQMPRFFPMNAMQMPRGVGSGFVWDKEGHVVTNAHVVRGASEVKVTLHDQTVYTAKVVGSDNEKDVALLQLDMPRARAAQLRPVTLGSSSNLVVGQSVFAIGNPFGLDQTLTSGIVSGLGRELPVSPTGVPIANVIQTDAAINPGNSGGVLLDSKGRLVGINTAIVNPTGIPSFSGVGFAIPIDSAKGLIEQLLKYGRVIRPYLGISLAPSSILRSRGAEGVLVLDVAPNGPAGRAGLRGTNRDLWGRINWGDIITAIDGQRVRNEKDMFAILDSCNVGQTVEVTVVPAEASMGSSGGRDGMGGSAGREGREARMLRVTLAERDAAFKTAGSE